ncbi:hypothetical protein ID866_6020 [Astraeus odoratus]|nr:hypothetical protein ID866_6020 [Astraeus odoratus]
MDLHDGNNEADPDQLFTKHTIAEVRAKQIQLRADAEAKQEELRIMVGERYRELLQSSTVIISIADSAKRVQDALDEISGAIHLQQDPPVHSRVSNINKEARVVHRALIRDDSEDAESWINQGVDVLPADILKTSEKTTPPKPPAAVIHSVQVLLEAISQTLKAAREIFGVSSSTGPMALRVLENMQAESFHSSASGQSLPVNLLISSQSVLSALPSSTYFSLLPANIRSYKPFVDLSSASSSLCSEFLEEKLGGWFIQSTGGLHDALHRAFSSLQSVGGVWRVRSAVHKWTSQCGLNHGELSSLSSLVEEVAGKRIMDIWKSALALAESTFVEQLSLLIPDHMGEFLPMHTMYPALPVPAFPPPGSGLPSFDLSFRRFRSHLAGQLHGRTPRLQQVLAILEEAAASLQRDLTKISSNGKESRLFDELIKTYRPEAENLCSKIIHALTESVDQRIKDLSQPSLAELVYHA